jgi:hypothetical protein
MFEPWTRPVARNYDRHGRGTVIQIGPARVCGRVSFGCSAAPSRSLNHLDFEYRQSPSDGLPIEADWSVGHMGVKF